MLNDVLSGLDPAGPGFGYDNDTRLRLDSSDAVYVDVIHTNIDAVFELGLGVRTGHVDIYPNKGARQPGCGTSGKVVISVIIISLRRVLLNIRNTLKYLRELF